MSKSTETILKKSQYHFYFLDIIISIFIPKTNLFQNKYKQYQTPPSRCIKPKTKKQNSIFAKITEREVTERSVSSKLQLV